MILGHFQTLGKFIQTEVSYCWKLTDIVQSHNKMVCKITPGELSGHSSKYTTNLDTHIQILMFTDSTPQCIANDSSPDVEIPVSSSIPDNQAKLEKPLKSEAVSMQQSRMKMSGKVS